MADRTQTFGRGVLVGGLPIALFAVLASATLLLATLARTLTVSSGFFVQQQAALIVLVVGGLLAAVGYVVAIIWAWRHLHHWFLAGASAPWIGALAVLAVTVLLVLLPLILAFVVPQHPAP
jgi:hypothetical protein